MSVTRCRIRGALLGCAIGDAFGRVLEGASPSSIDASNAIDRRLQGDATWHYSDDTEMMLGVAESLLAKDGLDPEHLLRTLATRCDRARGYGHGTLQVFDALARGERWRRCATKAWAEGSRGNGAAVRVVPLACWYERDRALLAYIAQESASVTHTHPVARIGAWIHAAALAHVLARPPASRFDPLPLLDELRGGLPRASHGFDARLDDVAALLRGTPTDETVVRVLGHGVTADLSVPLALYAFARHPADFATMITYVARLGGDVDTIAAMAGALGGAWLGASAIPDAWIARLENGVRGRDHITATADAIDAAIARRNRDAVP